MYGDGERRAAGRLGAGSRARRVRRAVRSGATRAGLADILYARAQVDAPHLAADRPDRVERLGLQQRPVGRDLAVEQRAHVGAERRRGDHVGALQVALGDEQEEQVAEVVPLVGADEQHTFPH